ncbi:MAG: TetR/AcrR family transcriptional regulator [Nannocystaceae bacterium]
MTGDVAIVNIFRHHAWVTSGGTYHHGDLRAALLEAALEVLAERGLAGLSLRECARRADVSHAAPYRHFADKDALVAAIAELGFARLARAGIAAMEGAVGPRDRLDAYGVAYVRFAVDHPELFRVMFTCEVDPSTSGPDGARAFDLLLECATALSGAEDPMTSAIAAWSLPHGVAMLLLDQRIPKERATTPEAAESLCREIFARWRGVLG